MNSSSEGPPAQAPRRGVSGKSVLVFGLLLALALAVVTYYAVPRILLPYFTAKPGQTDALFNTLSQALLAYRADHGTFPPEDSILNHRRLNKNVEKTGSVGMTTFRVQNMIEPKAYIDWMKTGDPYAIPEQFTPPAYSRLLLDGQEIAVMTSPGPNLRYEIRSDALHRAGSREELIELLHAGAYDPTNGVRSSGDYFILVDPANSPSPVQAEVRAPELPTP